MPKLKELLKFPLLLFFAVFMLTFTLADMSNEDRLFSAYENRMLAQRPPLTPERLLSGQFASEYEAYVNDQFVLRDGWVAAKAVTEELLGKIENNGVIFGEQGFCFKKRLAPDMRQAAANAAAAQKLLAAHENARLGLIPSAASILHALLPQGAPVTDERALHETFFAANGQVISLFDALEKHADEYIYYRSDHHWTTLGAYHAYAAICGELGLQAVPIASLKCFEAPGFLGSYYRRAKRRDIEADVITLFELPLAAIEIPGMEVDSLYNTEQLAREDKYAAILHGNQGLTVLQSAAAEVQKDSLLLLKDSFGNSIAPFFLANYRQVILIDLRFFNPPLSEWLKARDFDDIIAIYNYDSLLDEKSLVKLAR